MGGVGRRGPRSGSGVLVGQSSPTELVEEGVVKPKLAVSGVLS